MGHMHPSIVAGPTTVWTLEGMAGLVAQLAARPCLMAVGLLESEVGFLCGWLCDLGVHRAGVILLVGGAS